MCANVHVAVMEVYKLCLGTKGSLLTVHTVF